MDPSLRLEPTAMQLYGFDSYYQYIFNQNKYIKTAGIAVIKPPKNIWTAKSKPILEQTFHLTGVQTHKITEINKGVYLQYYEEVQIKFTPKEFFKASQKYIPPDERNNVDVLNPITDITVEDLNQFERCLYKNLTKHKQLYGSSFNQTLFSPEQKTMNLNEIVKLNPISLAHKESPGITKPMLIYATFRSTFIMHTENHNLAAINYLHWGAPKVWFAMPNTYYSQILELLKKLYADCNDHRKDCANWPAHKVCFLHSSILDKNKIPYTRVCSL